MTVSVKSEFAANSLVESLQSGWNSSTFADAVLLQSQLSKSSRVSELK